MLLYIGSLFVLNFVNAQNLQPCPENPIQLTASDHPQYVYSPYNENQQYPPNTDCRFVLTARDKNRRVSVNVLRSELEEPIFTNCTDYVSVRDGHLPTSTEIVRWCGADYPISFTSLNNSLYIHFHSDNVIEGRGFNLSFTDYFVPGCPLHWIHNTQQHSCYRLFTPMHGYTWIDAQQVCNYEKANLLTISNQNEYTYILNAFSKNHTHLWMGYTDANKENVFEAIDPKIPLWPKNFPIFEKEHSTLDCVFFDWNIHDGIAYSIDDCRNRHSFICKKADDGSTISIPPPVKIIREGIEQSRISGIVWMLFFIAALIVLLIFCLLLAFKQNRKLFNIRVANVDQNQRLVTRESVASTVVATDTGKNETKTTHSKVTTITSSTSKQDQHHQNKQSLQLNKNNKRLSKFKNENARHEESSHTGVGCFNTESEDGDSPKFHMSFNQPHPPTSYTTSVAKVTAPDVQKFDFDDKPVGSLGNGENHENDSQITVDGMKKSSLPVGIKNVENNQLDDKKDSDTDSVYANLQNQAISEASINKNHEEHILNVTVLALEDQKAITSEGFSANRLDDYSFHQHEQCEKKKQIPIENTSASLHVFTSTAGASKNHHHILKDASTVTDPVHRSVQSEDFDGIQMNPMNPHTQKKRRSHIHILNNIHATTVDEMWERN